MRFSLFISLFLSLNLFGQNNESIDDFTLTEPIENQEISLSSFRSKNLVVVIFTSNYCPYAKLYDQRLINLQNEFEQSLQVLLINSNDPQSSPEDSREKMKAKAVRLKFPFPYLMDKDQEVAGQFGARKTPEAFLLKPSDRGFEIIYSGAIDDNPQAANDVKSHYLKTAIQNALKNQSIANKTVRPTGCLIRGN